MRRLRKDRRGAALPLAILVIGVLMVGALAGLARVTVERRIMGNLGGELSGFALAQSGLSRYLVSVTVPPPASFDTVITGLPGGTDSIAVRLIRPAAGNLPALYIVRSSSVNTAALRFDARTPNARRSTAEFAIWRPGTMTVFGAWTGVSGLESTGGAGTISGFDQCGSAPAVAGVAVPTTTNGGTPGYDQHGGLSVPTGSPAIASLAPTSDSLARVITIDWNGIVNNAVLRADYTLAGSSGWPSSFANWPIIFVGASSLVLGPAHSGQGLLVVTGDLALNGPFSWNGVVLVGGKLISNGNNVIEGSIVTGLNVKLAQTVAASDAGSGSRTIRYDSCKVSQALSHLGSLVPIENAWVDNWPGY